MKPSNRNEGGIPVPMIAYVSKMTKPDSLNASPVIVEDFFPSILELAKAEGKPVQELDSKSF